MDEIERAMVLGEQNHRGYFERIALPHKTWEERRCSMIAVSILVVGLIADA